MSSLPTCVTTCLATGSLGSCSSLTDYVCICSSAVYQQSVANCWAASCNATEIATGEAYSAASCAQLGVTITTTYSAQATAKGNANSTVSASSNNSTSSGNSTANAPASTDTITAPVIYSKTSVTISAVMSTVCSFLLCVALLIGFFSCRSRIRHNQAISQSRSWTAAGSHGDTKNGRSTNMTNSSPHGMRSSQGGFGGRVMRSYDPMATFALDTFGGSSSADYGLTSVDYGESSKVNRSRGVGFSLNRGGNSTGFTNRLTLGDIGSEGATGTGHEQWEMETKSVKEGDGESPTTPTTRMGSEVDLDGSTSHLNVNILTKGDGSAHAV